MAVMIDPETLATLPPRELRSGLAECIKHEIIRDADGFSRLEKSIERALQLDIQFLAELIEHNVAIKARVVEADPFELGERAHLNFGHTFGHAIESAQGYGAWLHGEAVATGMALAARFSVTLGRLQEADARRLIRLLERLHLPVEPPAIARDVWLEYMGRDKKNEGGRITLILLDALGRAAVVKDAPGNALETFLAAA
jgi:3-dehydroquinate synthase